MNRRRTGFTLLEILIVMGVILILGSMLFVGMKYIGGTSKAKATKATLENCKALMTELEVTAGLSKQPTRYWTTTAATTAVAGTDDFWRNIPVAVPAPGDVNEGSAVRLNWPAVRNTGIANEMFASVPNNKKSLLQLPPQTMAIAMANWASGTSYVQGNHVRWFDSTGTVAANRYFICIKATNGTTNPSADAANWLEDCSALLDGWGNPVIFVPSIGMTGVNLAYVSGDKMLPASYSNPNQTIVAPDNRPFFASAGPDGDFSQGDDNIYSFSN